MVILTVALGSVRPVMRGVLSPVRLSVALKPESSRSSSSPVGAAGARVSMVKGVPLTAALLLPAFPEIVQLALEGPLALLRQGLGAR